MMKHIWTVCLLALCSCNTVKEDNFIDEDYEKLFPIKEIEKPENKRGELVVQLCDPNLALKDYKYPGEEAAVGSEKYNITVRCEFKETDHKGNLVDGKAVTARYEVRYINDNKELVTVFSNSKDLTPAEGEEGGAVQKLMSNGESLDIRFTAYSGFPIYLSVRGVGPRNSSIKASIKAVSTDGLIEIPALQTEQYQNEEGPNRLKDPYCEYIVLP